MTPTPTTTGQAGQQRRTRYLVPPAVTVRPRIGPVDLLSAGEILALVPTLPIWDTIPQRERGRRLRGAETVLHWLLTHPGDGWQDRWLAAGADRDIHCLDKIVEDDPRAGVTKRNEMINGLGCLLLCRVVLPDFDFLAQYKATALFARARQVFRPDLFAELEKAGPGRGMHTSHIQDGIRAITKIVLHTGRDIDQLTAEDIYEYRERFYRGLRSGHRSVHAAWELLQGIGVLPADKSLRATLTTGQRTTEQLVDTYQIQSQPVRDLLVRYLTERRPAIDYTTLSTLAQTLAGLFWADIERHHPGLTTLDLPQEAVTAWKQRLRHVTAADGTSKPRKNYLVILGKVRSFYLDIQEWALQEATWATWAAPSPVRRSELLGMEKVRKQTVSEMHQRVRERLPHLPTLVESAERHRIAEHQLLANAKAVPVGQTFEHDGVTYLRTIHKSYAENPSRRKADRVLVENVATGTKTDLAATEDEAFWAWAVIETLRHTGVRAEELLEITHLALVSYRLPDTGEIVPLLQIVPSKTNEERLLLVSPELASVLASIINRLRNDNNGSIPLEPRYDAQEKTTSPPLPHLFQRKIGWRSSVISATQLHRVLNAAIARAGLFDATGQPLRYTPHDFRRMFTTDAVTGGLPVHIAAKLLGHRSIDTVDSYLAVFQDELIRTYRAFLDKRRAARPEAEYREPTEQEWQEFQQHFQARKVALGDCARPYGSPCQHEHSCVRCPMLRVSPSQRPRLLEIIRNLADRITEARANGWLGEVQGLEASLTKAKEKLASLDRAQKRGRHNGPVNLGLPIITDG